MRRACTAKFSGRVQEIMLKRANMQMNYCMNTRNSKSRRAQRKSEGT